MSAATLRKLIISFLMLLIASAIFSYMMYRVDTQGEKLVAQIDALAKQNADEALYLKLQRLEEDTTDTREALKRNFLSDDSDSIDFLTLVESLAPRMGLVNKTSGLDNITNPDGTKWVKATFTFSGSRDNVQNFIKVLESLPYVLRLNEVSLSAQSSVDWKASVTMQVQIL